MRATILGTFIMIPMVLFGSVFDNKNVAKKVNAETTFDYSTSDSLAFLDGYQLATSIYNAQMKTLDFCQSEKEYLESSFKVKFDDISNKKYNVAKLEDSYWVEAFADGYYTPKYLQVGDETFSFERLNKQFIARADTHDIDNAKIVFERNLDVSANDANKVLTSAYSLGKEESENRKLLADYEVALTQRLQYEEDFLAYNNYQIQKAAYDVAKEARAKYEEEDAVYQKLLKDYNNYINVDLPNYLKRLAEYNEYLEKLAIYEKNKDIYGEVYERYSQQMSLINDQLSILDTFYNPFGDLQISAYEFINSGSVDIVIERRGEIVAAGVEGVAVDTCKEKTIIAKRLMEEYLDLKDRDKSEKYLWYKLNYIPLRNTFNVLTGCLEYFYSLSIVKKVIKEKGRDEKYRLFVAELIYFCDMLSKDPVASYLGNYILDSSRKIGGDAQTYPEMLKTSLLDPTIDPIPLNSSYPVAPGEAISIKPKEVAKPEEIPEVKKPIAPTFVEDPGEAPSEVKKPNFVDVPINPNVTLHPEYEPLADAYIAGQLINRTPVSSDISISIERTVDIDSSKVTDVLALFDTRNGVTPGLAKFKELVYFNDPKEAVYNTKLDTKYGYISSCAGAGEVIFADAPEINTNMEGQSLIKILSKHEEALDKFGVKWIHVLDNEEHKNFVELGTSFNDYGYELKVPAYNKNGTNPYQPNKKVDGHTFKYVFVGFDYTNDADTTENGLSGLSTVADICEHQQGTDSIVVYAVFKMVEVFEVSFNNGETKLIEKGTSITPFVTNPSKPDSDSYRYEFVGWSIDNINVVEFPYVINENVDFKPIFNKLKFYQITFEVDGKIIDSQKVAEGYLPVAPSNIEKERNENNCYEFDGWTTEIGPAHENIKYVAKFITTNLVDNVMLQETKKQFNIVANEDTKIINISKLLTLVKNDEIEAKTMNIFFKDIDVHLNASQISYLANVGAYSISFEKSEIENKAMEVRLVVLDAAGDELSNINLNAEVVLDAIDDASHLRAFDGENEIKLNVSGNSSISFTTRGTNKLILKYYYKVSFDKYMSALTFFVNGEEVSRGEAREYENGTQIQISATPNNGVKVLGLFTLDKNGRRTNLNENPIEICDSNLSVFADIEREIFTVNIYIDGRIFQQIKATYGSMIALPTSVVKLPDEEFRYVFVGWDKEVEVVTENVDINAVFQKIAINDAKGGEEVKADGLSFAQKLAIGALSVTIGSIALAAVLIFTKIHRKPQN